VTTDEQDRQRPDEGRSGPAAALSALGRRLWQYSATRGGLVFVAASLAAGLSNFVFHLVLSRLLGPVGYGALGALLNVTTVLSVPLGAVSVTVAQSIARRANPSDTPPLGRLLRLSLVAAVVGVGLWLAATPTIDRFFHLHSPAATIVLGLWLIPTLPGAVLEGVLLGQRRFRVVGVGQLAATAVRLASGVVLVEAGLGIVGGMAATVLAGFVVVAVYVWVLRHALLATGRFVPRVSDALLSTLSIGGAAVLTTIDAWLARHFLPAHAAGLFVAAATAGNIALFLPGAITMVYFPRLAASGGRGPEARQALARVTALVAVVGLGAAMVMALVPRLVVDVLFGPAFAHASAALGTVALADAGIGVASCLIYFQVARRSTLALAAWPTCVVALVLAAAFHGSIEVLALDMVAASAALVLGLSIPTAVSALRSLADDTASLPRQAILLEPATVDLTVVVPCRNVGASRLAAHLHRICDVLTSAGVAFEVIPVSDGSSDGSEQAFDKLPGQPVRPIVWSDNRGKGEALRIGLAQGHGRYLGFIDGDGDIPADGLAQFVAVARRQQPDVVVGSKRHPDAQVVYPPLRRVYSVGYQLLTRLLFGLRVRDTQTGVKLIRRDVVAEVLPRMVEKRFAFDLELLAVAHRLGYRQVAELPVVIGERFTSTISARSVWRMLQDTLATFWRLRVLRFYDPPLVEAPLVEVSVADQAIAVLGAGATAASLAEAAAPGVAGSPAWVGEAGFGAGAGVLAPPAAVGSTEPAVSAAVPGAGDLAERLASGQRLRILVCNWRDLAHPHAGGAEVYTHRVARAWVDAGHEVTWFTAAVAGRPSMDTVDGIRIIRRGGRHAVYRQARLFWERQGRGRFDLVVDEVNTRPFGAQRWARGTPAVALVHQLAREVWFHELSWPVAAVGRFLLEPRWLRQLRAVPVMTVSASSRRSLVRAGVDDVTVVPEGIDPVEMPDVIREAAPTVVFVGRLAPNKRPDHAVEAFRLLQARIPQARLWMVGTGPMEEHLRRVAPDGVEMLGRLPEEEKRRRLARAHCLVATSAREGWGLTVTEAAQVGTPAIAYDVDGLRDSVTASGGVLVAAAPRALADALAERLPAYAAGHLPAVSAGGVVPWPEVADRLLDRAAARVSDRRRAAAGEDVAVAWRRALVPVAAVCDRRAWSVAAVAALVALAPLSEAGVAVGVTWAAAVALVCLAMATVGTLAEAMRHPAAWVAGLAPEPSGLASGGGGVVDGGVGGREQNPDRGPVGRPGRGYRQWAPGAQRWPWLGPVAVVGIVSALAAQSWAGGAAVTSGAVPPWLGAGWAHQLVLGWTTRGSGLAGPVSAVTNLPWAVLAGVVHGLGGGTGLAERLWLTGIFAAVGMAAAVLLWVLGLGAVACVVGGVAYGFSPYVLTMSGLNPAYLAAMALVPALAAWVLVAARRPRLGRWWLAMVPAALLLGVVVASPPMAVAVAAAGVGSVLLAGWLGGRQQFLAALRRGAVGAGVLVISATFWAVPYATELATTSMVSRASQAQWGWAEPRATLANGLWLNDTWSWPFRQLFPYAAAFHRFPLVLWRYVLPIAAFIALGVAATEARRQVRQSRLRLLAAAGVVALVTVVVSTGPHAPGAPLFGLLTALPFGWLLKEPGRFLFVAGLAYAVMLAVLVDQWRGSRRVPTGVVVPPARPAADRVRLSGWLAPVGLCVALVVPAYPLVTGGATGVPGFTGAGNVHGPAKGLASAVGAMAVGGPAPSGRRSAAEWDGRLCSVAPAAHQCSSGPERAGRSTRRRPAVGEGLGI
jgi:glycosyltransferase involved in cell wall biosynthesis/O-antigen/teichoic acid export membrane protein